MQAIKCDAKGRVYLKESLRRRYGERFIAVPAPGEIVLIPVPADPVQDLRRATKKVRGMTLAQLKSAIQQAAEEQVVG